MNFSFQVHLYREVRPSQLFLQVSTSPDLSEGHPVQPGREANQQSSLRIAHTTSISILTFEVSHMTGIETGCFFSITKRNPANHEG